MVARFGDAPVHPVFDTEEYFVEFEVLVPAGQGSTRVFASVAFRDFPASPFSNRGATYELLIMDGEYYRFRDTGTVHIPSTSVRILKQLAAPGESVDPQTACAERIVQPLWATE